MRADPVSHHPLRYYETSNRYYVWKPSGIASVPGKRVSLFDLFWYTPQEKKHPQTLLDRTLPEGGLVVRLDVCTSGLVLFAKNRLAYHTYKEKQDAGLITKIYYATVYGRPSCSYGVIACFLAQHRDDPVRVIVQTAKNRQQGKKRYWTETLYEVCDYDQSTNISLIRCEIQRGFRHQIRCHLQLLGFPIVGDNLYIPSNHPAYLHRQEPDHISLSCMGYTNLPDAIPVAFSLASD
ncbi:MAG: RNA pseudouridine synthase [Candidatus Absconditabacterales bacterium]|nr:RNA pseudouridine synthase [Candidatus Absconditabacterales bacterium]